MYLKKLKINNYKNYYKTEIDLEEGLNVIVGSNNSGKSNLLTVLNFLSSKEINCSIENFNKNYLFANFLALKTQAPIISIDYEIEHILDYEKVDSAFSKLLNFIVYDNNGNLEKIDYNKEKIFAVIKLRFELDPRREDEYKNKMANINNYIEFFNALKTMEEYFVWNFYSTTDIEKKEKKTVNNIFEVDFIEATRLVGKLTENSKKYLYVKFKENDVDVPQIKSNLTKTLTKDCSNVTEAIDAEIAEDQDKIGINNGKNKFVSSFSYDGDLTEFFKYQLEDEHLGYNLPLESNGLGYNNLIYMRNLIKEKKDNDFNLLMIEEPEAHLHPNMQYKLLKYINELKEQTKCEGTCIKNQIILTTHSSNITAAAGIDAMILLTQCDDENIRNVVATRLSNNFEIDLVRKKIPFDWQNVDGRITDFKKYNKFKNLLVASKEHLEKFLDVTRSDFLFSDRIIFVEGLAERMIIPKIFENLIDEHVSVVELAGINFNHFLPICLGTNKKVLCITDRDFNYFEEITEIVSDENIKKTQLKQLEKLERCVKAVNIDLVQLSESIKVVSQNSKGNTFETELFIENFDNYQAREFLMKLAIKNLPKEFYDNINIIRWQELLDKLKVNKLTKEKLCKILSACLIRYNSTQTDENKNIIEKLFFAIVFYSYIEKSKGDLALRLVSKIGKNSSNLLICPQYIREGVEWLLKK